MSKQLDIIVGMESWWRDLANYSPEEIRAYNQGILRAAEAIRRLDNYDEERALFIHRLLYDKLPIGKSKSAA